MTAQELFEEKQHLVFAAIKQQFRSYTNAARIAEKNNMEIDDLIQVGRMTLWQLCLKYDPSKEATFNKYVIQHMKWRISDEIHMKGLSIKVSVHVSPEERKEIGIQSIDLHRDEETKNEFFAVSPIDVEKEAITSVEFQEVMKVLDPEERYILKKKSMGYTDKEIGREIGRGKNFVNKRKNREILKINPNYNQINKTLLYAKRKNHLPQQVI